MEKSISINRKQLPIKEYKGQRVVTFKDIDMVHGRSDGTAGRNFRRNKSRFIEGMDYFKIQSDEFRRIGITSPRGGIVITESGYLMLAKSFTDDLAWKVQRGLVNNYFRVRTAEYEQLTIETKVKRGSIRDCMVTLETLEFLRDVLKSAEPEDTKAVNAINTVMKYTAWELGCRIS